MFAAGAPEGWCFVWPGTVVTLRSQNTGSGPLLQCRGSGVAEPEAERHCFLTSGWRTIPTANSESKHWAGLREGAYMLRTNLQDGAAEELWSRYMQLTEAEASFRALKSELSIRPLFHQKEPRVTTTIDQGSQRWSTFVGDEGDCTGCHIAERRYCATHHRRSRDSPPPHHRTHR